MAQVARSSEARRVDGVSIAAMACWWGRKMVEATRSGASEVTRGAVERGAPESPEAIPGGGNNEFVSFHGNTSASQTVSGPKLKGQKLEGQARVPCAELML